MFRAWQFLSLLLAPLTLASCRGFSAVPPASHFVDLTARASAEGGIVLTFRTLQESAAYISGADLKKKRDRVIVEFVRTPIKLHYPAEYPAEYKADHIEIEIPDHQLPLWVRFKDRSIELPVERAVPEEE